ncbi:MAG: hypothetical protein MUC88_13145, partial [Planctomycetes bacterium]|nr:hypothetical protein [Planctomycetota bacterium]
MDKFKAGELAFTADARDVALKSGVSATADDANNVVVFTMGEAGPSAEASVGGPKSNFQPLGSVPP